ncbi:MAG TPA: hypothetical protein EYQ24_01870, partial [Bacteroidetes bacterium]|nr:hypothetical protein [Bacteroidota bacterium]
MRALCLFAFFAALPSVAQPVLVAEADPGPDDGSITELVAHKGADVYVCATPEVHAACTTCEAGQYSALKAWDCTNC